MHIKHFEAFQVGLVLGIIWLIIGYNYNNNALLMIGSLVLSMGLFFRFKKVPKKNRLNDQVKRKTQKVKR